MGTILIVILVLLLIGALPTWGYSRGWGYFPSGGLGLVLVIVLILVLLFGGLRLGMRSWDAAQLNVDSMNTVRSVGSPTVSRLVSSTIRPTT